MTNRYSQRIRRHVGGAGKVLSPRIRATFHLNLFGLAVAVIAILIQWAYAKATNAPLGHQPAAKLIRRPVIPSTVLRTVQTHAHSGANRSIFSTKAIIDG